MQISAPISSCATLKVGLTLLFAGTAAGEAVASQAERAATLEAIHQLENPRNLNRPGPRGELGAYQFRVSTWRMHTAEPFHRALDRAISDEVAVRHYEWLKRGLSSAGRPVSPYMIALAWNGGLTAAIQGRAPRAAHDYAARATNLVGDLRRQTLVASAVQPKARTLTFNVVGASATVAEIPVIRPTL